MTRKIDPDIKLLRAMSRALEEAPRHVRFRALAYLVAREAGVATCSASEWLYDLASAARSGQPNGDGTKEGA